MPDLLSVCLQNQLHRWEPSLQTLKKARCQAGFFNLSWRQLVLAVKIAISESIREMAIFDGLVQQSSSLTTSTTSLPTRAWAS